jgi:hypothetical protein
MPQVLSTNPQFSYVVTSAFTLPHPPPSSKGIYNALCALYMQVDGAMVQSNLAIGVAQLMPVWELTDGASALASGGATGQWVVQYSVMEWTESQPSSQFTQYWSLDSNKQDNPLVAPYIGNDGTSGANMTVQQRSSTEAASQPLFSGTAGKYALSNILLPSSHTFSCAPQAPPCTVQSGDLMLPLYFLPVSFTWDTTAACPDDAAHPYPLDEY